MGLVSNGSVVLRYQVVNGIGGYLNGGRDLVRKFIVKVVNNSVLRWERRFSWRGLNLQVVDKSKLQVIGGYGGVAVTLVRHVMRRN